MSDTLFLLVSIAGRTVAIDTAQVQSVVEIDEVTPVPRVPTHVAGLFALRSRVLTVIDAQAAIGLGRSTVTGLRSGVVLEVDGHGYALLVDDILDVVDAPTLSAPTAVLGEQWARVAKGRITVDDMPILVIAPRALIDEEEALAA